jgi:transcriptional regulator with XRE-family HTH domain
MDTGIGRLISQLRSEREISQTQLAQLLASASGNPAVTRNEVSRWEQGRRRPRRYWLEWLAVVFGMSLFDLEDLARLATPAVDTDEAEAIELRHRVAASDVGRQTLERLEAAVDDLAIAYRRPRLTSSCSAYGATSATSANSSTPERRSPNIAVSSWRAAGSPSSPRHARLTWRNARPPPPGSIRRRSWQSTANTPSYLRGAWKPRHGKRSPAGQKSRSISASWACELRVPGVHRW